MSPTIAELIPLALLCLSALGITVLFKYLDWAAKKAARKNPLTSDLLRGPGESLRERIDDLTTDVMGNVSLFFFMPVTIYAMVLSMQAFSKTPSVAMIVFYVVCTLALIVWLLVKITKALSLRGKYRLGLDAEIAIGQELNHLMREGFWVFHDFPAGNFNIDHVVIGSTGVFAVETKGRSKPISDNGSTEREVLYDGSTLKFPGWEEQKPLEQAARQAQWLQDWLSRAVGEPVSAQPVLALPGWFVKRTKSGGVPVINGKNCSSYFMKSGNGKQLSKTLINRIVFSVEQHCRNVQPRAYRVEKD